MPTRLDEIEGGVNMPQPTTGLSPQVAQMIGLLAPQEQGKAQSKAVQAQIAQQIKTSMPVPTADQRDRQTIASEALRKVQAIRETLGISNGQLTKPAPLTIWKQTPNSVQNPFLAPDAKQLRTQFNSAADLLAMLRTGKQGERTQVDRVIAEYNPGNFDDAKTVMNRLDEMEQEIRAFGSGQLKSPLDAAPAPDALAPDEAEIVNRLLRSR